MKIEASAQKIRKNFHENWDPILADLPLFKLDYSWPSVATLDQISYGARLQEELPSGAQTMIKGCACYLAQVVAQCWKLLAEDVEITYSEENGVRVIASNSSFFGEDQTLMFPAQEALTEVLTKLPNPLPVIRGSSRQISFDSNVVSVLGLGACLGLHPSVEGAWVDRPFSELKEPLQLVTKELARQTSEYYARVFPKEPLGAVAEIYLSSLIFPPLLVGEPLPALNAIQNVFDFAKQYGITRQQLCRLGRNWARLADDTISAVGLVLYAACTTDAPGPDMVAVAQGKSEFMGLLRSALVLARKLVNEDEDYGDWLETGLVSEVNSLEFEVEQEMLFLPWLILPMEHVKAKHSEIKDVLYSLSRFEFEQSVALLDEAIEKDPSEIVTRLQRIKLEMIAANWDKSDSMFRDLLSESETDNYPLFYHLWALVSLSKADASAALRYCKAGIAICPEDSNLLPELKNNMGWATLVGGEVEESLQYFEDGLKTAHCPLTLLLNKAHVLWRLGQDEELTLIKNQLKGLSPTDRRVFASLAVEQ